MLSIHLRQTLPLLLLPLFLLGSLSGCGISNSTTNPSIADPIVIELDGPSDTVETTETTDNTDTTETEPIIPPNETLDPTSGLKMIGAGGQHNCSIKNVDDSLWCWGSNEAGQLGDNSTNSTSNPTAISSGFIWQVVVTGDNHSCGIDESGSLLCWGENESGQVGNASTVTQTSPIAISTDTDWRSASLGTDHSCAIKNNGSLWCWGDNYESQLGDGGTANSISPIQIETATTWSNISLGNQFSCGIQTDATNSDQTLWCWGRNDLSQLGHVTADNQIPSRVDLAADWIAISAGDSHACAIKSTNQSLYCWGNNLYGQLGQGDNLAKATPTQVMAGSNKWLKVSAGGNHTCAIQDDDSLWCWGNNSAGQLGIGTTSHMPSPQQLTPPNKLGWYAVSSGKNHTCAIDSDDIGHCWGLNNFGQLGNGIALDTSTARQFDTATNWNSIDSGALHSCGLKTDPFTSLKTLWCGGINNFGQLGIGSTANQSAPVQIKGRDATLEDWAYVSNGHYHSCAIQNKTSDNTKPLYCWGRNSHNQLATDIVNSVDTKENISQNWSLQSKISQAADDWLKIDAGASHTCGIKNTDELWCWGDNFTNQMGRNSANPSDLADPVNKQISPIQVMEDGLTIAFVAKDVAVGGYTVEPADPPNTPPNHSAGGHTCAIKTDGTLWCWGENDTSQLGDQTIVNKTIPTQIIVDTAFYGFPPQFNNSWVSVKAGNRFTCGLQTNQKLYCWGDHTFGETGTGVITASTTTTPVPVTSVTSPKPIVGNHIVLDYAVGQNSACAITSTNELWCWGYKGSSQATLDAETAQQISLSPAKHPVGTDWQSLTLGMSHGCGIREDADFNRTVYCWGDSAEFQFGNGSAWKETPQQLPLQ